MKLAVYGNAETADKITALIAENPGYAFQKISVVRWDNYNDFISQYQKSKVTALLVTMDGGDGLEAMTAANTLLPDIPRVWFSSDKALGAQAMRLGAVFFGEKPLTKDNLTTALRRCGIQENYIETIRERGTEK